MDQPKIGRILQLMKLLIGNVNYTIDELEMNLQNSLRHHLAQYTGI